MLFKFHGSKVSRPAHVCDANGRTLCQIENSANAEHAKSTQFPPDRRICKCCLDLMPRRGFDATEVGLMQRHFEADIKAKEMSYRINDLRTPKGGWKKADLEKLNVPWPPPRGWQDLLIAEARRRHLEATPTTENPSQ